MTYLCGKQGENMAKMPFIYGKVAAPVNFTNRVKELENLKRNFLALNNTILISPRRWGKTSLVHKAIGEITKEHKNVKACHLDIFNIRDEKEFYTKLAEGVLQATSTSWEDFARTTKTFLSQLIPQITLSSDMQNELSFGINFKDLKKRPDDILDLAEKIAIKKKIKLVICIDEFQSIHSFDEALDFQKKLRSHWQHHSHVSYCLYGSKRHMLLDVFTNSSMPFYKFGDLMLLEKISTEDWISFIMKRYQDTQKKIDKKNAKRIADLVGNHPYYVQQLAQQSWFRTEKVCDEKIILKAHEDITDQLGLLFANLTESLSSYQVNLLEAIIQGEKQLSSQRVINEYQLGSSANVVRLKRTLIETEILNDFLGEIEFLDPYYEFWLRNRFFDVK